MIQNNTSFQQVIIIIQQTFISNTNIQNEYVVPKNKNESDNTFMIILGVIGLGLYLEYHEEIINWVVIFAFACLLSVLTVSLKLYWDRQFDRLNKSWISLMLFLILINFVNAWFMNMQDLSTGNITLFLKIMYFALGFFIMILPSIFHGNNTHSSICCQFSHSKRWKNFGVFN